MIIKPNWDKFKEKFIVIDNIFDWFQSTKFGTWYLKGTSFLKVLSLFGVILITQVSAYFNFLEWSSKIDEQLNHSDGFVYVFWFILSFIVPDGNLFIIFISIVLLAIAIFFEYRKTNVKTIDETLLVPLKEKTKNLLFQIKTNIDFDNQSIEIDRSSEINRIQEKLEQKQVIIVSGDGGVGKTAIVKNLYSDENIFYVVKAIEFKEKDIFYGHNLQEFIDTHKDFKDKIFVIDSAEKLLDIENREFFKEFLSALIQNDWKIIFTTRNNYLDDLNYELIETYKLNPYHITINNISVDDLQNLSTTYKFTIPADEKLISLILNPFYLNQFLQEYNSSNIENYLSFKTKLWNRLILKSNPNREKCFLELAYQRANSGLFFIDIECEKKILKELLDDGILGFESGKGYFITHDIYEEWALEKIIEKEFSNREDEVSFFQKVGSSLPIRRSFRDWVSDKLLLDDENIKSYIEKVIENRDIEQFWKDEVLISVLLSEYSDTFFDNFEKELFDNDAQLLKRVSFLLRIACKEADNSLLEPYGLNVDDIEVFSMFNKPKGNGWESFIKVVYKYKDKLGLKYLDFILPVIKEWQTKKQKGNITKKSALLALFYYDLINQLEYKYSYDESIKTICNIIIAGSFEIQDELKEIFESIIKNKWKNHGDNYYKLSTTILSTEYGVPKALLILKYFPSYVFKIADLFWTYTPKELPKGVLGGYDREEVETAFGIEKYGGLKYFPDSALQTPIYYLLRLHQNKTVDFIIDFMNKCVENYSKSDWEDVVEVEIIIDENLKIKQYHSQVLWNIYRGISSPVMPGLLKCIHMALEKYILEVSENTQQEILETFLKYLLIKSKSSSISAIVASIVLAYPDKTFNIAHILFKTKEFIRADFIRQYNDNSDAKFIYGLGYGMNVSTKEYQDERLKTCEDKHRNSYLESLFLNYQLFRTGGVSEEEADKRQKILWDILDNYYSKLPKPNEQTETEKTWSITLARMDRRKQDIEVERVENGVQLTFNSKLEPEVEKYSKQSQKESLEKLKYTNLYLWSKYRLEYNQDYKKYTEFEENPLLAIEQLKEILDFKEENKNPLIQNEIFSDTAIVLLRDFSQKLSKEEMNFCKDLLIELAKMPFQKKYNYQISDGTDSAISHLPLLLKYFPDLQNDIKLILLLNLFRDYERGMSGKNVHDNVIDAIVNYYNNLEIENYILGYLLLKPKYDFLYMNMRKENYRIKESEVRDKFLQEFESDIKKFIDNDLSINDIDFNIDVINISVILKFIKFKQVNPSVIFQEVSKVFILKVFQPKEKEEKSLENMTDKEKLYEIFSRSREEFENIDLRVKQRLFESLPHLIYKLDKIEIEQYLKPLLENFRAREDISYLLLEFIRVHDVINEYDKFWYIWNLFEKKIIEICKDGEYSYADKIIQTYLLAWGPYGAIWKEKAKTWHTIKEKDKRFFKRISEKIGHCPSTLYSISKLLTGIGSSYLNDGISWISYMVKNNKNLFTDKLELDTVFHIENLTRKYILENSEKIKKDKVRKKEILEVLNFLVEKGSAIGYMLRERVL